MTDGVLHVSLDEGRIAAVRVIGIVSPQADRILTQALVTDAPVRRGTLERAILLVSDIPGVSVKGTSYVRQNGFGILLVTAVEDKASAYLQVDNRGSAEVGPIRATMLANVRGVAQAGDELRLIAAATPVEPSEFAFLRGVYAAPVDARGSMATVSASVGRANPGASLKALDVVGNSVDVALGYARPLLRSRRRSAWASMELRALRSDQALSGTMLRNDRLVTLTGTINGTASVGPGVVRGEVSMVGGLPVEGVSHEGDPLTSRSDGDARFVTWGYTVDWTATLVGPVAVTFASSGQLASRPLLATAEIGAGGPGFGRAYDYAERTGDQGILGSMEMRADLGRVEGGPDRLQLYGFVDGGYVDNLRDGPGGGALLSTGTGARLGYGVLDGMIEIAFPLNADRFDTNSKRPRVSFRVARTF
jgi:hemolysin activation/secretion protein